MSERGSKSFPLQQDHPAVHPTDPPLRPPLKFSDYEYTFTEHLGHDGFDWARGLKCQNTFFSSTPEEKKQQLVATGLQQLTNTILDPRLNRYIAFLYDRIPTHDLDWETMTISDIVERTCRYIEKLENRGLDLAITNDSLREVELRLDLLLDVTSQPPPDDVAVKKGPEMTKIWTATEARTLVNQVVHLGEILKHLQGPDWVPKTDISREQSRVFAEIDDMAKSMLKLLFRLRKWHKPVQPRQGYRAQPSPKGKRDRRVIKFQTQQRMSRGDFPLDAATILSEMRSPDVGQSFLVTPPQTDPSRMFVRGQSLEKEQMTRPALAEKRVKPPGRDFSHAETPTATILPWRDDVTGRWSNEQAKSTSHRPLRHHVYDVLIKGITREDQELICFSLNMLVHIMNNHQRDGGLATLSVVLGWVRNVQHYLGLGSAGKQGLSSFRMHTRRQKVGSETDPGSDSDPEWESTSTHTASTASLASRSRLSSLTPERSPVTPRNDDGVESPVMWEGAVSIHDEPRARTMCATCLTESTPWWAVDAMGQSVCSSCFMFSRLMVSHGLKGDGLVGASVESTDKDKAEAAAGVEDTTSTQTMTTKDVDRSDFVTSVEAGDDSDADMDSVAGQVSDTAEADQDLDTSHGDKPSHLAGKNVAPKGGATELDSGSDDDDDQRPPPDSPASSTVVPSEWPERVEGGQPSIVVPPEFLTRQAVYPPGLHIASWRDPLPDDYRGLGAPLHRGREKADSAYSSLNPGRAETGNASVGGESEAAQGAQPFLPPQVVPRRTCDAEGDADFLGLGGGAGRVDWAV